MSAEAEQQQTQLESDPGMDSKYYDSIEGVLPAAGDPNPQQVFDDGGYGVSGQLALDNSKNENADALIQAHRHYEKGLVFKYRKEYLKSIEELEVAYRLFGEIKQYYYAIKSLTELAWLKYCHDRPDGVAKSARIFKEAKKSIEQLSAHPKYGELKAHYLHYQGLVKYRETNVADAMKDFMQAKSLCHRNDLEKARVLDSLAIHYENIHDYQRAIHALEEALHIKKVNDALYEESISSEILGRIYNLKEDYLKAEECLMKASNLSQQTNDMPRFYRLQADLVKVFIHQNKTDKALSLCENILKYFHNENKVKSPLLLALYYKAFILFKQNHFQTSREILSSELIPLSREKEHYKSLGMSIRLLGKMDFSENSDTRAIQTVSEAMGIFREHHILDELAETYLELGNMYCDIQEDKLALASYLEALHIAESYDFGTLVNRVEEALFNLDQDKWLEVVEDRTTHQKVMKKKDISSVIDSLTLDDGNAAQQGNLAPSRSLVALLRVSQAMSAEQNLTKLLNVISLETKSVLDSDRCTVFLYDKEKNELWSKVATGIDGSEEIRFPAHLGLAGYVAKTGETLNIKDAYQDPRFNKEIDKKTGYHTKNILCLPMKNRRLEIIGVFQVLNKNEGSFDASDEDLLMAIATQAAVAIENASLATELKISFESFVKTLSSTIDARDPITAGHSERVAEYSLLIGKEMNMNTDDQEALKYASLLHDVGKIGIKEEILKKDGRLTEKEYRHIQKHVYYTHEILKNVHFESHLGLVPEIAASHHEKIDGTGYHRGLKGNEILLSGRILAIADVFDAITSRRHYRNRMPFDRVLSILKKDSGSHFDEDCIANFFQVKLVDVIRILACDATTGLKATDKETQRLLSKLDANITIQEFEGLAGKEILTPGEIEVSEVFKGLYHRIELDNSMD